MTGMVVTRNLLPEQCGWKLRPDLGPNVWERPDGSLYRHHGDGPLLLSAATVDRPKRGAVMHPGDIGETK